MADSVKKRRIPSISRDLIVPADEPIFVLRGQDAYAVPAIRAYVHICLNAQNEAQAQAAEAAMHDMENWQAANHTRVKQPDSPATEEPVGVPPVPDEGE